MTDRIYENQEKGQKDTRYLTRRGFYMDYHVKIMKVLPASCKIIVTQAHIIWEIYGIKHKIKNSRKKIKWIQI